MYNIAVSNGEILDKYTILIIKLDKIKSQTQLLNVKNELKVLEPIVKELINKYDIEILINKLKDINNKLWNIEDNIREKEKLKEFDQKFIDIARSVYYNNDIRAQIKYQINTITNSELCEEKSYESY